ncbi:transcriptional regulator [Serratia sp. UGAL515B_01]|uniref:transcriptional regulator n=1 Tax=Serratia sp. UGAL515B_01 TaxID=2986763 RepID=UPI00295540B3|nr:YdaS family helix-turn-helix protein [Serratia sp. UGAL515B_01]WON77552.1 helix-turn-helix domain-containing protein [Serratia sp. UGAL515B_01]
MKHHLVEKAIAIVGSQAALVKAVGKAQSTVSDWLNGKKQISVEGALLLSKATDGKIHPSEFRPDKASLFEQLNKKAA